MTRDGRPTLETVAVAAGVSPATVSKVLNDRVDVAAATRSRVQRFLDQYEYVPPVRRSTHGRQVIELIFTALDSPYSVEIMRGVTSGPVEVVVSSMPDRSASRRWSSGLVKAGRSGVIIVTSELTRSDQRRLARAHMPYVLIDPAAELPDPKVATVGATNWAGGLAAVRHLLELGHRRIGVIGGPVAMLCSRARISGYSAALASAGVEVDPALIRNGNLHHVGGYQAARELFELSEPPTAIFAGSDEQAFGVAEAARATGRRIPDDLSVVGFDDLSISRWFSPPLTTVRQPLVEMGRTAAEMLLEMIDGREPHGRQVELATELVVRSSTGPPPGRSQNRGKDPRQRRTAGPAPPRPLRPKTKGSQMSAELHVATTGSNNAEGSADQPLRTISRAAALAQPGDTVVVHGGEYREWVKPQRGGLSNRRRITYTAAPGERVVIKGSEPVTGWERAEGDVWTLAVPNALFGSFNPFAEEVDGDWIVYADQSVRKKHLGDVYLNGTSFYEVATVDEVSDPPLRTEMIDTWTGTVDRVRDPAQTQLVWYAEVGAEHTTIWANFSGADPNSELVEINVRRSVFYPTEHHLNYITVRGFELAQAATPWAPPTADQPGLIGPNWAKGWIIEDNVIHDAKCSAVSLGKESSTGHNFATVRRDKPGYQYQLESVFSAIQIGWDREHIGSHIVRRNTIYDCGQNGVVGHLGCVFSTIEDNHIYNIAIKREFYGYEIAGIKLHAALDVVIRHNRIHDCSLGTWLDWQTQGTRVSRNLFYGNSRDLFIEVSHGPHLVDHNILASRVSLEVHSQGGAFVNNLLCGTISMDPIVERPTPYHVPHSTHVAGYAAITGGDDRYIGNVFLGSDGALAYGAESKRPGRREVGYGTAGYDGHPATMADYLAQVSDPTKGDHERFANVRQPVYIRDNVYASGAEAYADETGATVLPDGDVTATVVDEGAEVYLECRLPDGYDDVRVPTVSGADLERVRFVDAEFEEPDGTPAVLATDLVGAVKSPSGSYPAGPLSDLASGASRTRVW